MTDSRIIARCVLMLGGAVACTAAMAQDAAPSAAASAAADRAQKASDRTKYWIRVLAQSAAPRPAPAAKPAPTLKSSAQPERAKVTAAAASTAPVAPSPAAATGAGGGGNAIALAPRGLDTELAAGLAAPALAARPIDVPPAQEEPDPGLVMVRSADPEFPAATMRRLRKGKVEVQFEVAPDGNVAVVTVMKSSHQSLNAAAMGAVRQWRFKPTAKAHTALVDLAFDLDS